MYVITVNKKSSFHTVITIIYHKVCSYDAIVSQDLQSSWRQINLYHKVCSYDVIVSAIIHYIDNRTTIVFEVLYSRDNPKIGYSISANHIEPIQTFSILNKIEDIVKANADDNIKAILENKGLDMLYEKDLPLLKILGYARKYIKR